jgi:hypothetical protein
VVANFGFKKARIGLKFLVLPLWAGKDLDPVPGALCRRGFGSEEGGVMAPKFNIQTAEKPELKERVAQLTTALIKQKEVRDFSPIRLLDANSERTSRFYSLSRH